MKHGSLRRSISLLSDSTVDRYSPDGLSETDIDALLAETGIDLDDLDDIDDIDERNAAPVVPLRDDVKAPTTAPSGGEAA